MSRAAQAPAFAAWSASLLVTLLPGTVAAAGGRFQTLTLTIGGEVMTVVAGDLDGDRRADLLVPYKQGLPPREKRSFAVFWNGGGGFALQPDLVLPVDGKTCAFDLADVDEQPGLEILTITPAGVNARSLRGRRPGAELPLTTDPTLFNQPTSGDLPRLRLAQELGGAGSADLLVPAAGALHVYRRDGAAFSRTGSLEVQIESRTRTAGRGRFQRHRGVVTPLVVSYNFPALHLADANGDGKRDIFNSTEDRVSVYLQGPGLSFPVQPTWQRDFGVRTAVELKEASSSAALSVSDLDGDGVADVVVRKQIARGIASASTTSFVYYGRRSGPPGERADQVIRNEGASGTEVELLDVTGDGRPDLVVPSVNVGVLTIIRALTTKTLKVSFQVFPYEAKSRRFADRPAAERALKFKLSLSGDTDLQAADIYGDFNGDRRPDLAFGTDDEELSVFLGVANRDLFADDALEEIPIPAFGALQSVDLDGKGKSDMVLHYPSTKGRRSQIVVMLNRGPW